MLSYYLLQGLLGHLLRRWLVEGKCHISSEIVYSSTIQNKADMMCVVLCYRRLHQQILIVTFHVILTEGVWGC